MPADPVAQLEQLLADERRLILSGSWDALADLAPRKEAALAALADRGAGTLGALAGALTRNQALLAAALDGVREALQRRAALRAARTGLVTYDARGLRAELPLATPRLERKA